MTPKPFGEKPKGRLHSIPIPRPKTTVYTTIARASPYIKDQLSWPIYVSNCIYEAYGLGNSTPETSILGGVFETAPGAAPVVPQSRQSSCRGTAGTGSGERSLRTCTHWALTIRSS